MIAAVCDDTNGRRVQGSPNASPLPVSSQALMTHQKCFWDSNPRQGGLTAMDVCGDTNVGRSLYFLRLFLEAQIRRSSGAAFRACVLTGTLHPSKELIHVGTRL